MKILIACHMKKILVVCAHPDDETLGMGATIALHSKNNDFVSVLVLADGELGRTRSLQSIAQRKNQALKASSILGVRTIDFLDYPDQTLDLVSLAEISNKILDHIKKIKPDIVYTHHWSDVNQDHRRAFEATLIAARPTPKSTIKSVICFETPSSTEWGFTNQQFVPNLFVDISSTITKKLAAFNQYKREMQPYPHPRSKESLTNRSKYWGSSVGLRYAEAFQIIREIK